MKVIAVNIDNVLADNESVMSTYLYEKYGDKFDFAAYEDPYDAWVDFVMQFPDEAEATRVALVEEGKMYNMAKPIPKNIEELNKWAWAGAVISIVCPRENKHRMLTELWLAQNQVPYSNLLFNFSLDSVPLLLEAIDAQVYIDAEPMYAGMATETVPTVNTYLLRTYWNRNMMEELDEMAVERGVEIVKVDYLDEIAVAEGIRTNG